MYKRIPIAIKLCAVPRLPRYRPRNSRTCWFVMSTILKDAQPKKKVILCLHGYLQNSEVFHAKIGSWRKGLRSRADFHFVEAPFLVDGLQEDVKLSGGAQEGPRRGWWTWQDTGPGMRPSLAAKYSGLDTSLKILTDKVDELKPDGLLGFSQGATAAALLLAHYCDKPMPFKFAVLIAGFLPRDPVWAGSIERSTSSIPILVIHGESDALIPLKRSEDLERGLRQGNESVTRISHPGAHMVPSCGHELKQQLQGFLDGF